MNLHFSKETLKHSRSYFHVKNIWSAYECNDLAAFLGEGDADDGFFFFVRIMSTFNIWRVWHALVLAV